MTDVWTVAIDLRKVDALLTMLKQLDDQESAGYLMAAGNQVGFWGALGVCGCVYVISLVCLHPVEPGIAVFLKQKSVVVFVCASFCVC